MATPSPKSLLLTGANGLLGQKLVNVLTDDPRFALYATGRGPDRNQTRCGYRYVPLDLTDERAVREAVAQIKPAYVLHAAAMTKVDDCERDPAAADRANVDATRYLIEAVKSFGAWFGYVSTDFVFDGEGDGLYDENASPNPPNYYGQTKLAAERLVQTSGLPWAVARTVLVYGVLPDMSRSNILLWVVKSLRAGKAIRVVEDQWRTPTYAEDLAAGCKLMLEQEAEGVFHLSGEDYVTPYDMAIKTADVFGLDESLISPTDAAAFKEVGKRPLKTGFDISKAKKALGYAPHSFAEGLNAFKRQLDALGMTNAL